MSKIGEYTLLATPEQISRQASSIAKHINELKKYFEEIDALVNGSMIYWEGKSADHYREFYNREKDRVEKLMSRMFSMEAILQEIAGEYETTEQAGIEAAQALPGDVIL